MPGSLTLLYISRQLFYTFSSVLERPCSQKMLYLLLYVYLYFTHKTEAVIRVSPSAALTSTHLPMLLKITPYFLLLINCHCSLCSRSSISGLLKDVFPVNLTCIINFPFPLDMSSKPYKADNYFSLLKDNPFLTSLNF